MHGDGDPTIRWRDIPLPRSTTMVAAFKGWNDAAGAASAAVSFIGGGRDCEVIAEIDPEEFFNFQDVRPRIRLTEGDARELEWPNNTIFATLSPKNAPGLLLVDGTEPSMRWRTFCEALLEVASECGVSRVVTLGSLLADVPHTRATNVTGFASDPSVVEQLGLRRSSYEGPTGIVGALHAACAEAEVASCSLWAAVPHYVAATPNPMAALALVRAFEGIADTAIDASELEEASDRYQKQVSAAVAADDEVSAYVNSLEESADAEAEADDPGPLPSGDLIAREFQRFLRRRADQQDDE